MPSLPVRVELRVSQQEQYCRFTIDAIHFNIVPGCGDPIEFCCDGWAERVVAIVQYVHHVVGRTSGSIICCLATFPDQPVMIAAFDRFKDSFTLVDPDMGGARPPVYYPAYRLLTRLWGKKSFSYHADHPTALAELIHATLLAVPNQDNIKLRKSVELIHKLIIEGKRRALTEDLELLTLIRDWDRETGMCEVIAQADEVVVIELAKALFSGLRSVSPSQLPPFLR